MNLPQYWKNLTRICMNLPLYLQEACQNMHESSTILEESYMNLPLYLQEACQNMHESSTIFEETYKNMHESSSILHESSKNVTRICLNL
jgi:hypothetical protein